MITRETYDKAMSEEVLEEGRLETAVKDLQEICKDTKVESFGEAYEIASSRANADEIEVSLDKKKESRMALLDEHELEDPENKDSWR